MEIRKGITIVQRYQAGFPHGMKTNGIGSGKGDALLIAGSIDPLHQLHLTFSFHPIIARESRVFTSKCCYLLHCCRQRPQIAPMVVNAPGLFPYAPDILRISTESKILKDPRCKVEPMIEKNAARGNILWFRLVGKLTEEDYTNNLMPELERALEQYKKIRLLIQVEYFGGWTEGGAWEELKGWPQFSKVERMAIVADDSWDEWMTWMVKITGIITGLSVRFFKAGRIEEAWDWLEAV